MPTKPYSQRIPSLHNGISTQAPSSRFPSQVADAENALFNVVNGVSTRAGTRHFAALMASGVASAGCDFRMHRIVRDSAERYAIVYGRNATSNMDVEVVDLLNPRNRVQYFTLGTQTAGTFTITFGGQTTAAIAHNASAATIQTAITGLSSVGSGNATVTASGSWFVVSFSDLLPFCGLLEIAQTGMTAGNIDGPYGSFCKVTGLSGAVLTYLQGGSASARDLRLLTIVDTTIIANTMVATGTTSAAHTALDAAKMPVKMERTSLVPPTFALSQITWNAGAASPANTAPQPIKDGKRIADVAYHRGRICFAMDEWMVTSQPDSLYNFFKFTNDATYNDSDPIVAQLGSSSVSVIDFLVPFRKALLVLTRNGAQFEIGGGDTFTPKTATLTPSTTYATQRVKPAPISSFIYFAGIRENTSVVYEYAYDDIQVSYRASPITQHVDGLLPSGIRTLTASDNNDTLIVVPGSPAPDEGVAVQSNALGGGKWSNPNTWSGTTVPSPGHVAQINSGDVVTMDSYANSAATLFLYRTLRVADKLVQSAWTKYTFGIDRILDVFIVEDTAYVLRSAYTQPVNSGSTASNYRLVLDTMPLAADPAAPASFVEQPRLDHRRVVRGGTVSGSDLVMRVEFRDYEIDRWCCQLADGTWTEGAASVAAISGSNDANVTLAGGAVANGRVIVLGRALKMTVTTSRLFRTDESGNAIVEGELFVNKIVTDHTNSGPYQVTVSSSRREARKFTYGASASNPDFANPISTYGRFSIWTPGRAQDMAITITNVDSRPAVITGIEFYGTHNTATEG